MGCVAEMNALSVGCLLFDVWCDVYSKAEFEAGWLAGLAGGQASP